MTFPYLYTVRVLVVLRASHLLARLAFYYLSNGWAVDYNPPTYIFHIAGIIGNVTTPGLLYGTCFRSVEDFRIVWFSTLTMHQIPLKQRLS
jgi:hypothetical protein